MIDQNQLAIRTEQRSLLMSKIRRGQIFENRKMSREALDIWLQALQESEAVVEECRAQLSVGSDDGANGSGKGKGRDLSDEHENGGESDGLGDLGKCGESNNCSSTDRLRLRAALEVQHTCAFFSANAYFQIKTDEKMTEPDSEEFRNLNERETAMYEIAKEIRQEVRSQPYPSVFRI
jgi:E3 ubiquitin-protein ligase SHPRH